MTVRRSLPGPVKQEDYWDCEDCEEDFEESRREFLEAAEQSEGHFLIVLEREAAQKKSRQLAALKCQTSRKSTTHTE